jgi:predicted metal-binding protein DUF2103
MGKGKTPPGSRKKTTSSHSTAVDSVEKLLKQLNCMKEVEKISLGVIKPGLRAGQRRVKIMRTNDKVLLLKVRCSNVMQEVRVYTSDADATVTKITAFAKKKGWGVS